MASVLLFCSIASDLPSRNPAKSPDRRPTTLVVTDLPTNKSVGQVRTVLRKLSQNCGGKVSEVRGSKAFIKFATPDAAERAQKRMDKEFLYGHEISVNFFHLIENDFNVSPFKKKISNSSNEGSESSNSSRDSSASPTPKELHKSDTNNLSCTKFDFPPPPVLDSQTSPSLLKNHISRQELQPQNCITNFNPFLISPDMEVLKDSKNFQLDWNINPFSAHTNSKSRDISAFSPFKKEADSRIKLPQKNVGRVTPFLMQECERNGRTTFSDPGSIRCSNSKLENTFGSCLIPNGYQNFIPNVSSSFEIQRIGEPYFYSPTCNGASAMRDKSLSVSRNNQVSTLENSCVELHVSNLDPTFEVNEMKRILLSVFREHVMVLHISMSLQPDGSPKATVKVPSLQDAQYAISRLHRQKIGHKRILISHISDKIPPFHILKSEAVALLNDIPSKSLPLIKFRELYEKRYHRPIAVSELYKMREAVTIQGDSGSRTVYLNTDYCTTPSVSECEDFQECPIVERPYCEVHFHVSTSQGWAEQYNICPLPLVHISLKILSPAVHKLLDSHQGSLPLISFCDCYAAQIGPLPIVDNFVTNREDTIEVSSGANQISVNKGPKGVPLEHLIACIAGVEVAKSVLCIKKVQWLENKTDPQTATQGFNPALFGHLTLFSREVMDLLKSQPQCLVQFNKFIPTYHHHFGRQCRVADYGFTKLIDLLEAIPHIVQVLGEGQNRQVTLTHRTQVRRFTGELLRILKSRASKQIAVSEFAQAYEQVIEKPFEIINYGICEIEDMINEVPENVIVTSGSGSETIISIPKREQTPEEVERTKQFADEVVELMKHTTNCSMTFNKFIPSYHHHFGKQCRVADYGFTKLIELFEVIPHVLEVKGAGEDKILQLIESEQHKILHGRLITVLAAQPCKMVDKLQLCNAYAIIHGHALRPSDFGFADLNDLLEKFSHAFKVVNHPNASYVCLVDSELICQISVNIRRLLMGQKDGKMSIKDACSLYQAHFQQNVDIGSYIKDLADAIQVSDGFIQLSPSQLLARDIILLLQENGSQIPVSSLGNLYEQKYGVPLCVTHYGFQNMFSMLENFSDYFCCIKGKRQKRVVCLNSETAGYLLYKDIYQPLSSMEEKSNDIDILNQPVPSSIPTPTIKPHVKKLGNLMGFETPPKNDLFCTSQPKSNESKYMDHSVIPRIGFSKPFQLVTSTAEFSHQIFSGTSFTNAPYKVFNDISNQPPLNSYEKCEATGENFCQNVKGPIYSEKGSSRNSFTKLSKSERTGTSVELDIKFQNHSPMRHDVLEQSEHLISNSSFSRYSADPRLLELTKYNHSHGTKDNVPSTESTFTNERRQNRRHRIAAQFSSPINE